MKMMPICVCNNSLILKINLTIMAILHSLDQEGVKFKVKVQDCVTDTPFDENDITDQMIVFYKPNGTRFEKQAVLVSDPLNPGTSFVQYQNTDPEASILDLTGFWEYAAIITLTSTDIAQTSQRQVFWVV